MLHISTTLHASVILYTVLDRSMLDPFVCNFEISTTHTYFIINFKIRYLFPCIPSTLHVDASSNMMFCHPNYTT